MRDREGRGEEKWTKLGRKLMKGSKGWIKKGVGCWCMISHHRPHAVHHPPTTAHPQQPTTHPTITGQECIGGLDVEKCQHAARNKDGWDAARHLLMIFLYIFISSPPPPSPPPPPHPLTPPHPHTYIEKYI